MNGGQVQFENTSNVTEVTKWYSIKGAPPIEHKTNSQVRRLSPFSVKFVFVEGSLASLTVHAHVMTNAGGVSEREQKIPGIHPFNQSEWPWWLNTAYNLAISGPAASV